MKKKIITDLNKTLIEINLLNDEKIINQINLIIKKITKSLKKNGKIILCGNGGSAAHAQHFSAEYVSKFEKIRKPLSAISLTTDTSIITSVSNDFNYKYIFSKQIEALGRKEDILLCYSTSGNSQNIIEAAKSAKKKGIFVVSHTGIKKNKLSKFSNINVKSPSLKTSTIQECHLLIDHIICRIVEENLSKN
tara:strand:+ start:4934 stop:5509 length:576 start_codon:yes stop_codon:yes gene_type:complete